MPGSMPGTLPNTYETEKLHPWRGRYLRTLELSSTGLSTRDPSGKTTNHYSWQSVLSSELSGRVVELQLQVPTILGFIPTQLDVARFKTASLDVGRQLHRLIQERLQTRSLSAMDSEVELLKRVAALQEQLTMAKIAVNDANLDDVNQLRGQKAAAEASASAASAEASSQV